MPKDKINSIERERILKLLAQGWTTASIASEVGVSPRQVAAVKAHLTMRSYGVSEQSSPNTSEHTKNQTLAPLTSESINEDSNAILIDKLQTDLSQIAIPIGHEKTTRKQIYWDPDPEFGSANPHLMIMGESGYGKTYTIQCLVSELAVRGVPSIIIDYGRGFDLEVAPKEFLQSSYPLEIMAGELGININPLQIHSADVNGPINVAVRISDSFGRVYRIGVQQHALLRDVILEVFEDYGIKASDKSSWSNPAPHLIEVQRKLEQISSIPSADVSKIALSLKSHISTFFIFNTFRPTGELLNWDALTTNKHKCYIIQLKGLEGRTQQVVTDFLLWELYYYMVRTGPRPLHLYCILDEAHNLSFLKDTPVDKLIRESRKFGVGLIFASQQPKDFSDTAYSNSASKLIFQTLDENKKIARKIVAKSQNVQNAEILVGIMGRLKKGQAFFITQNNGFEVEVDSFSARHRLLVK